MKSYTTLRNLFGTLTSNSNSTNLTLGDELINDSLRRTYSERDWPFLQKSATAATVASQQFYDLPYDYDALDTVTVTIGTTKYTPREAPSQAFWDELNQTTSVTSNFPEYYYIFNGQLGFYPTPSSSTAAAITFNYRRKVVDLSRADFSTGTLTATNGSTSIVNSGSNFTTPMAGRWIRITATDVAATTGDGAWYQIESVTNGTTLVLDKAYNGTSTAGAAYVMGQMPILPEAFHDMPVFDACSVYFTTMNPDAQRAEQFKRKYQELLERLRYDYGTKTSDPSCHDNYQRPIQNSNLFVTI